MDGQRFDQVAKAVASGLTRRAGLRALAGGLLAAPLGLLGGRAAAATCRERGRLCDAREDCCGAGGGRVACRPTGCGQQPDRRRCCGLEGAGCDEYCDCCGDLRCGRLDPTATKDRCFACKPAGEPCSGGPGGVPSDDTCCTGLCVGAGECSATGSCVSDGPPCDADTDCCLGQLCVGGACVPISA